LQENVLELNRWFKRERSHRQASPSKEENEAEATTAEVDQFEESGILLPATTTLKTKARKASSFSLSTSQKESRKMPC
jgi:hypothetical protein